VEVRLDDEQSRFGVEGAVLDVGALRKLLVPSLDDLDFHLENFLYAHPDILSASKWAAYLPVKYRLRLLKQRYFDFEGAERFREVTWVGNRGVHAQ
jgi:ATP-dependent Lhr-like helicase